MTAVPELQHHLITLVTHGRRPYLFDRYELVTTAVQDLEELDGVQVSHHRITSHHLHLILTLADGRWTPAVLVRRLKTATSRRAQLRLWERAYHHCPLPGAAAVRTMRSRIDNSPLLERFDWEDATAGRSGRRSV
jgi:REP element-mobilizing transposase RayT